MMQTKTNNNLIRNLLTVNKIKKLVLNRNKIKKIIILGSHLSQENLTLDQKKMCKKNKKKLTIVLVKELLIKQEMSTVSRIKAKNLLDLKKIRALKEPLNHLLRLKTYSLKL